MLGKRSSVDIRNLMNSIRRLLHSSTVFDCAQLYQLQTVITCLYQHRIFTFTGD